MSSVASTPTASEASTRDNIAAGTVISSHAIQHLYGHAFYVVLPEIYTALGLTPIAAGLLGAARMVAGGAAATVGGVLIDRLQHRRLLILYISLISMGFGYPPRRTRADLRPHRGGPVARGPGRVRMAPDRARPAVADLPAPTWVHDLAGPLGWQHRRHARAAGRRGAPALHNVAEHLPRGAAARPGVRVPHLACSPRRHYVAGVGRSQAVGDAALR